VYYADPIAAIFMMMNHGVMFIIDDGQQLTADRLHVSVFLSGVKFNIHPDSYPIFNAQSGDMVLIASGNEAYRINVPCRLSPGERIVLRGDVPFIWPEVG